MPARSSWKGFLRLSLVSIPVKAYTAASSGGGEISLNQLHAKCNSRIKYQKTCPLHGEVTADEIVMGYEYDKGQYVVIDPAELESLRSESDKAINIETFVPPEEIDPIYFTDKSYYLTPDGPAGQKSFALLQEAMEAKSLCCVGQVVLHNREQLVLVRPMGKLLCMTTLHYQSQVKPAASFEDELSETTHSREELKLVNTLIEATTRPFDYAKHKDLYTERLTQLIESKVEGKELVAAPAEAPHQIINLMEALQASVKQAQASGPAVKKAEKPAAAGRKMAASARVRRPAKSKRKTG